MATRSQPIAFLARYQASTPEYDEDFDVERTSPDEESSNNTLSNADWFDEEINNTGKEHFLALCGLTEAVKAAGHLHATVVFCHNPVYYASSRCRYDGGGGIRCAERSGGPRWSFLCSVHYGFMQWLRNNS